MVGDLELSPCDPVIWLTVPPHPPYVININILKNPSSLYKLLYLKCRSALSVHPAVGIHFLKNVLNSYGTISDHNLHIWCSKLWHRCAVFYHPMCSTSPFDGSVSEIKLILHLDVKVLHIWCEMISFLSRPTLNPRKVGSLKRHQRLGGGTLCRPLNIDLRDFFWFFLYRPWNIYKLGAHAKNWVTSFQILYMAAP